MAKYKRISLGHKYKEDTAVTERGTTAYPTLYISDKKLPLKSNDVGKTLSVSAKMKFIGIREENRGGKEKFSYDFEVREITF